MSSALFSFGCSHDFYWSRRRQGDVCRRCGAMADQAGLHWRTRGAWTVGAELPPLRDAVSSPPKAETPSMDFSGRDAAPLHRPLVT